MMTDEHKKTAQILDRLVQSYPRGDLKLQQVFALDEAKQHIAQLRAQLESRVPTGDGQQG